MSGNAVAIGKRLGVKPTLARRVPAAGRNGKRLITGDPENANRIIGKGVRADKIKGLLSARRAAKVVEATPKPKPYQSVTNVRPGGRLNGNVQGVGKAAPGTNGMGTLVPQFRGASMKSLTPQAPSFAPKASTGAKAPGLVAAGGSKPPTAGLSGVSGSTGGTAGTTGGGGGGAAAGGVGKRRYDPEDERRHRQGFAAATSLIGGGALGTAGARQIHGETRRAREQASKPSAHLATLRPSKYPPPGPTGRTSRSLKDGAGKLVPAQEQRLAEAMAHDVNHGRWSQQVAAWNELQHGPRRSLKGAVVTRGAGGKLGGGLALAGLGLTLHRHRREPRWD